MRSTKPSDAAATGCSSARRRRARTRHRSRARSSRVVPAKVATRRSAGGDGIGDGVRRPALVLRSRPRQTWRLPEIRFRFMSPGYARPGPSETMLRSVGPGVPSPGSRAGVSPGSCRRACQARLSARPPRLTFSSGPSGRRPRHRDGPGACRPRRPSATDRRRDRARRSRGRPWWQRVGQDLHRFPPVSPSARYAGLAQTRLGLSQASSRVGCPAMTGRPSDTARPCGAAAPRAVTGSAGSMPIIGQYV